MRFLRPRSTQCLTRGQKLGFGLFAFFLLIGFLLVFRPSFPRKPSGSQAPELLRAVITHHSFNMPSGEANQEKYLDQLKFFHRSWVEVVKTQKKGWITDFVIIATRTIPLFESMNCTTVLRKNRLPPSRCIVIDNYKSYNLSYTNFNVADNIWTLSKQYEYIDSIGIAVDENGYLDVYDYLFRCDEDSFLAPYLGQWHSETFQAGSATYILEQVPITQNRLDTIAKRHHLVNQGLVNIGASWYGNTKTMKECAKLSIEMMYYMYEYEFTPYERSTQIGTRNWADWHFGILTLYSGHLAINHCTRGQAVQIHSSLLGDKISSFLDAESTSDADINRTIHVHCWGDPLGENDYFLKGKFEDAAYHAGTNLSTLNLSIIRDYCLYMALDSRRTYQAWNYQWDYWGETHKSLPTAANAVNSSGEGAVTKVAK